MQLTWIMWMCRHMWFSAVKAFACCLSLWLSLFWQKLLKCRPRDMDNGLSHSGTAFHTLSTISTATPAVDYTTHPFFSTPERCWPGANHHWVFEWLSMCACVCACFFFFFFCVCICVCGNQGSTCLPRAMLINALQTKCSLFFSLALSFTPPILCPASVFWVVIAKREGGGDAGELGRLLEGNIQIKQNMSRSTLVCFDNAELSHCLPAAGFDAESVQYTQLGAMPQMASH